MVADGMVFPWAACRLHDLQALQAVGNAWRWHSVLRCIYTTTCQQYQRNGVVMPPPATSLSKPISAQLSFACLSATASACGQPVKFTNQAASDTKLRQPRHFPSNQRTASCALIGLESDVAAESQSNHLQIVASFLRLGFIAAYLSDQVVQGLTTGAAMFVFTSQVPLLLGLVVKSDPTPLGLFRVSADWFSRSSSINAGSRSGVSRPPKRPKIAPQGSNFKNLRIQVLSPFFSFFRNLGEDELVPNHSPWSECIQQPSQTYRRQDDIGWLSKPVRPNSTQLLPSSESLNLSRARATLLI